MDTLINLPKPTRQRLVQLMGLLKNYDKEKITSIDICKLTGWNPNLIRHDLWLINCNKGVSNGYYTLELCQIIQKVLNTKQTDSCDYKNCCIVGLGRLGSALLDEGWLEKTDFRIKAGFDSNVNKVEILRSVFPLYPSNQMEWVIKKEKIEYAILAVNNQSAIKTAERLVNVGIKGIVNITDVIVHGGPNVKVQNISVINALQLVV